MPAASSKMLRRSSPFWESTSLIFPWLMTE